MMSFCICKTILMYIQRKQLYMYNLSLMCKACAYNIIVLAGIRQDMVMVYKLIHGMHDIDTSMLLSLSNQVQTRFKTKASG